MEIKALSDASIPKLLISIQAMAKVRTYVDVCEQEIGWMGLLRPMPTEEGQRPVLLLDAPYAPSQEVSATKCDLDPDGDNSFFSWCMTLPPEDRGLVKWWGHSHVNMGTMPSGTDMETFYEHIENDPDTPFVMTIHNKKRETFCNLYVGMGLYVHNAEIAVYYDEAQLIQEAMQEVKTNLREKKYVKSYPATGHYSGGQISQPTGARTRSGGNRKQSRQQPSAAGNAKSNAVGLRSSGKPQLAKPSVQPGGRRKKQSRSNGAASAK